jgi:hypothetical protein
MTDKQKLLSVLVPHSNKGAYGELEDENEEPIISADYEGNTFCLKAKHGFVEFYFNDDGSLRDVR